LPTTVLSVRVRKELKEEAERLGIDIRAVIERALEDEVRRRRAKIFEEQLTKALSNMNVSEEEWIRAVKETRKEM